GLHVEQREGDAVMLFKLFKPGRDVVAEADLDWPIVSDHGEVNHALIPRRFASSTRNRSRASRAHAAMLTSSSAAMSRKSLCLSGSNSSRTAFNFRSAVAGIGSFSGRFRAIGASVVIGSGEPREHTVTTGPRLRHHTPARKH